jgi:TetR/AcrR family transcriptional repressor of mexJK operon
MPRQSKKDAILAAAEKLFIGSSFTKVSMDEIAAKAPVSKPTLYAHFKDKAALFTAVIETKCARFLTEMRNEIDLDEPPAVALRRIGTAYLEKILSVEAINLVRVVIAASDDFPHIAQGFYNSSPRQAELFLADYIEAQHKRKKLKAPDAAAAAETLIGLWKGNRYFRHLLELETAPDKKTIRKAVDQAVDFFLTMHGT